VPAASEDQGGSHRALRVWARGTPCKPMPTPPPVRAAVGFFGSSANRGFGSDQERGHGAAVWTEVHVLLTKCRER
jgi:hypothetical protein